MKIARVCIIPLGTIWPYDAQHNTAKDRRKMQNKKCRNGETFDQR